MHLMLFNISEHYFTLFYISRHAEVGAIFFYADGLPGEPTRDHNATPRAHLYGKRIASDSR